MKARWFIRGGGKVYGPLDDTRLRSLVAERKIDESTEVAVDARGPWHAAGRVRGLFATSATPGVEADALPEQVAERCEHQASLDAGAQRHRQPVGPTAVVEVASPKRSLEPSTLRVLPWAVAALAGAAFLSVMIAAAFLFISGSRFFAQKPEQRVEGSAFIVKADGEAVKLALMEVYFVPSEAVTNEAVEGINAALKELRSAEHTIDYYSRPSELDRAFSSPEVARRNRQTKTTEALIKRNRAKDDLARAMVPIIEKALRQTKTDADGLFEAVMPVAEPVSIVAYAARKVGADSEHYVWIVPGREVGKLPEKLFLSNDNQLR
jgi:hypothetical protein